MARLTEEMVIARTKASDLSNIRKLNCWGSELSDVSLLRKMRNVEVLSLSVNKIDNLSDFQFCRNLQELYVRKNEIRDLNQVCYLQDLPQLKNLWLGENPCAENDQYRPTVLRALPRLKMLDNVTVQPQEVEDAMRRGTELIHPEEMQDASSEQQWLSESSSPAQSPSRQEEYIRQMETSFYDEYDDPPDRSAQTPSSGRQSPPRRQVPSEHDSEPESRRQDEEINYYDTDRRNANYEPESMRYTRQPASHYNNSNYEKREPNNILNEAAACLQHTQYGPSSSSVTSTLLANTQHVQPALPLRSPSSTNRMEEPSPSNSVRDLLSPQSPISIPMKDVSPNSEDGYRVRSGRFHSGHEPNRSHHGDSSSEGSTGSHYSNRGQLCDEDLRPAEERYRQPSQLDLSQQRVADKGSFNNRPPYSRRPVTRNSNILSAVLCLIKELDYPSLEVVEMAVRSRMDEM